MYQFYLDGILLPVTPGRLRVRIADKDRTLTLVNEGEINLLKTPGLTDIDFSCILPMVPYAFARYQAGFRMPSYFLAELERLKTAQQPFTFAVIRTPERETTNRLQDMMAGHLPRRDPERLFLFNATATLRQAEVETNMQVSLGNYGIVEDAARDDRDMRVDIPLKQARPFGTKTITIEQETGEATTTEPRETTTAPGEATYSIVSGDTLWSIAARKLGSGTRHGEIFRLNEAVIEAAARARGRASSNNGHWIFPGTVIRIPAR